MPKSASAVRDMGAVNREFYDALWNDSSLQSPERFNTWPEVSRLATDAPRRLEVGPGLRPRLPIAGTTFIDLSPPAVERLRAGGGEARSGDIANLPFAEAAFDLVCAFDVVEHVTDDLAVFCELARVVCPGGRLIFSVPLHPEGWTEFDNLVGHVRRYPPDQLLERIASHGFALERSAVYGMQPTNTWLLRFGMWWLKHFRGRSMFLYNRVFMPLGLRLQKPLVFVDGLVDHTGVDEVVLICRRLEGAAGIGGKQAPAQA